VNRPLDFDWYDWFFNVDDDNALTQAFAFTIAGFAYGGLHLVGRTYPFVSHSQCLLWHICAVGMTISGAIIFTLQIRTPKSVSL
jgi:hypothetical protein